MTGRDPMACSIEFGILNGKKVESKKARKGFFVWPEKDEGHIKKKIKRA